MVRRRHGLSTHTWPGFEDTWHVKPELNRGMWADDASHAIDFLLWLLGEPETVTAQIATLRDPRVPDDHGIAIFRYRDGTFAEVVSSFVCLAGENTTEIVGEDGVIIQNYGDGPSAQAPRPKDAAGLKWFLKGEKDWIASPIPSPASHGERIAALAPELLAFLEGERPPICTAEEGRTSLRMTLACYRSSELERTVRLKDMSQTS
jgi:predicted dehydrogenase